MQFKRLELPPLSTSLYGMKGCGLIPTLRLKKIKKAPLPNYSGYSDVTHEQSQHQYGNPGNTAKQLENGINRSMKKKEFHSPHLFLHFYVFENCVNSPRFCKHCSKCSCISHCKNPCSNLKKYIYKKKKDKDILFSVGNVDITV